MASEGKKTKKLKKKAMLQVHTLLGVGDLTAALRAAGNGLLTKIVGAAAKFVLRATRERANAV